MAEKETVIVDKAEPDRREVVERSGPGGALIALIVVIAIIVLFLLFGGMNLFGGGAGTGTGSGAPAPGGTGAGQ